MRMPDIVLQRGFAVVDVSHEAYDWWPGLLREIRFFGVVSLRLVCLADFFTSFANVDAVSRESFDCFDFWLRNRRECSLTST